MPTLNWLTRADDEQTAGRVPYRLLEPAPELSAGDPAAREVTRLRFKISRTLRDTIAHA